MSVRKDLDDAKLRPCGSDDNKKAAEIDVVFDDVAKKKALEASCGLYVHVATCT